MIKNEIIQKLKNTKNLLAFSAGIDSTALFFLLLDYKIEFDIAIVDYNLRDQSKQEVAYAHKLGKQYNKICYTHTINLNNNNFEASARKARYDFFENIIYTNHYQVLLTAHQLNDKLEWFLMQFCKGAGVKELYGLNEIEQRDNYELVRPLLSSTKDELQGYLENKNIQYFVDNSNYDTKYKRNLFRHKYANELINEYKSGIKNSFEYIKQDINSMPKVTLLNQLNDLYILQDIEDTNILIKEIDKIIKKLGYLLSKAQKDEILTTKDCIISDKIAISFANNKVYIAPYQKTILSKTQKELYRIHKIPPKIRFYLALNDIDIKKL